MGRRVALSAGLALTVGIWMAASGVWPPHARDEAAPGDLRSGQAAKGYVAGPVVELPPASLGGRQERRTRSGWLMPQALMAVRWRSLRVAMQSEDDPDAVVQFPEDWLDGIPQHTPRADRDEPAENDAGTAAILTTLDSKRVKGLTWEAANLDQVVEYLRTITGLDFLITPKVRGEAFGEVEISLDADDVTVRTVLDLVTEPYDLRWTPKNGVVTITTKDELAGDLYLRYFDLKDLEPAIEASPAPAITLASSPTALEPTDTREPAWVDSDEAVVAFIRETVGDAAAWEAPAVLEIRHRILIARNTAALLDRVQALLDDIRATDGLRTRLANHRWNTFTGAPPRAQDR